MSEPRQRLCVVGSGISGLIAAEALHRHDHDVTVLEAADYVGGHTHTVDVVWQGERYAIDTGFIVFNDWTYPNFMSMLERFGVPYEASSMSFSVHCEQTGVHWCGTDLNSIFAQRRNALRPRFLRMLWDILKFNKRSLAVLEGEDRGTSLGDLLRAGGYSRTFIDDYIVPMGAAIWSASPEEMLAMPARFFVRFFKNHGMLSVDDRPEWQVIQGGSRSYVDKLTAGFRDRIELSTPVRSVRRFPDHVEVTTAQGSRSFDGVVFACHSDQALGMLEDPSEPEREILGAIRYQENETVLHVDDRLMPPTRRAWASWNYHKPRSGRGRVAVTYNMNILQGIEAPVQFLVTLNRSEQIPEDKVIRRLTYHHPMFGPASTAAQARHREISGTRRTWYCGAYWGNGFHEDGVQSGLVVARQFGLDIPNPTEDRSWKAASTAVGSGTHATPRSSGGSATGSS